MTWAETCCEMTHSHLMKWQMAKLMMANWAHLLLYNLKQIHIPLSSQIMLKYTPKYKFKD